MYYRPYEEKILKLARIRDVIYKFRFLILGVIALISAGVITFLAVTGSITSDTKIDPSYTYGETISPSATAFLSDVDFEYYVNGSWTKEKPVMPGEYRIRAMAKNGFGGYHYGAETPFTIEKKELTVTISKQIMYGDTPEVFAKGLIFGDTFLNEQATFKFGDYLAETHTVTLQKSSFKIVNESGADVTEAYAVASSVFGDTPIDILPRPITITTESAQKTYDGEALTMDKWSLADGELVPGDAISAECTGTQTLAGKSSNDVAIFLTDEDGRDISSLYDITIRTGVLEVTKRPLAFLSDSNEWTYDGKSHEERGYDFVNDTSLGSGDKAEVSSCATLTDVATQKNVLELCIVSEAFGDVTFCYDITPQYGTIAITPRPITVTVSDKKSVTYTGVKYTASDYVWSVSSKTPLVDGEWATGNVSARKDGADVVARDAGEYVLTMSAFEVWKEDSARSTGNYKITFENGSFTIFKRALAITVHDSEKTYDGTSFSLDELNYATNGNEADGEVFKPKMQWSKNCEDAGTYAYSEVLVLTPQVWRGNVQSTQNYEFEVSYGGKGTLTIQKRAIKLALIDKERPYNTKPLTSKAFKDVVEDGYLGLIYGHTATVQTSGSITEPGETLNDIQSYSIKRNRDGKNMNGNYKVTLVGARLRVIKRNISVTPINLTKVYDGKAARFPDAINPLRASWMTFDEAWEGENINDALYEGCVLQGKVGYYYGDVINVGTYWNATYVRQSTFSILDKNGQDVTDKHYEVTFIMGQIDINARTIHVLSKDVSRADNGTLLIGTEKDCYIDKGSLAEGHTIWYTFSSELTTVGTAVNHIASITIVDKNGTVQAYMEFDKDGHCTSVSGLGNYWVYVTFGTLEII